MNKIYVLRFRFWEDNILQQDSYTAFISFDNAKDEFDRRIKQERVSSWQQFYNDDELEIDNAFIDHYSISRESTGLKTEFDILDLSIADNIAYEDEYIDIVMNEVCSAFKILKKQLVSDDRTYALIQPRIAFVNILDSQGIPKENIAKAYNRDRSSIYHANRKFTDHYFTSWDFRNKIREIVNALNVIMKGKGYEFNYKLD